MSGVERVILLAGPSCAGKTTLLQNLETEELAWFRSMLDLGCHRTHAVCNAWEWPQLGRHIPLKETLLIHYDIFRVLSLGLHRYEDDPALNILHQAGEIEIVTLWEWPAVLLDRAQKRKKRIWLELLKSRDFSRFKMKIARRRLMRPYYLDPASLWAIYEMWFAYCALTNAKSHWMLQSATPESLSLTDEQVPQIPVWST